jgi:hypothetical protein
VARADRGNPASVVRGKPNFIDCDKTPPHFMELCATLPKSSHRSTPRSRRLAALWGAAGKALFPLKLAKQSSEGTFRNLVPSMKLSCPFLRKFSNGHSTIPD